MSDKTYGQIACEASLGDVWDSLPSIGKIRWNESAQAVIDEYKRRHEEDTKPLPTVNTIELRNITLTFDEINHTPIDARGAWVPLPFDPANPQRNYPYDPERKDWFPRVHADGDNYVEDSIS